MLVNYINDIIYTFLKIDFPTRLTQDLLCANGPNGANCLYIYSNVDNSSMLDIEEVSWKCICDWICEKGLIYVQLILRNALEKI